MNPTFVLYGANGYTGRIILDHLAEYGLRAVLAGRSEEKIRPLARQYDLPYRIVSLDDAPALDALLDDATAVLHVAGPFIRTARPMVEACLRTRTHYLDITGEIPVFEMIAALGPRAREAGILLAPGVGFDVVPTDCIAVHLKQQLPEAAQLQLAFATVGGGISQGSAKTMVENLGVPGAVRKGGKILPVPLGHKTMWAPFPGRELFTMTVPWGDVSTAYYSTGIPDIETYSGIAPRTYRWVKLQRYFTWLLRRRWVRQLIRRRIDRRSAGPDPEQRARSQSFVWGRVTDGEGQARAARLSGPNGYTLTARTSLLIMRKVLNGEAPSGFQTPAMAFGPDLILEVPGVVRQDLPAEGTAGAGLST